jgi:hypothetical protein
LAGRQAGLFQGKNAVVVIYQVIHQIGNLRERARRVAAQRAGWFVVNR